MVEHLVCLIVAGVPGYVKRIRLGKMPTSKRKKDWKQCNQYILFDKRADARLGLDANCLKPNLYFGFRRLLRVWKAVLIVA